MSTIHTVIRHWLPFVTICPVNKLPDFLYVTITFDLSDEGLAFPELYDVRRRVAKIVKRNRLTFMEDLCMELDIEFPLAKEIKVALWFNRHEAIRRR